MVCLVACGSSQPRAATPSPQAASNPPVDDAQPSPHEPVVAAENSCLAYSNEQELCEAFQDALPRMHGDWNSTMSRTRSCERMPRTDGLVVLETRVRIHNYGESYYVVALPLGDGLRPVMVQRSENIDGDEDSCEWTFRRQDLSPFTLIYSRMLCTMPASMEGDGSHGVDRATVLRVDGEHIVRTSDAPIRIYGDEESIESVPRIDGGRLVYGAWSDGEGGERVVPESCELCGPLCDFDDLAWTLGMSQGSEGCVSDLDCMEGSCSAHSCGAS